jgi:drug/metabolite transporter (DMT)-like permease
MRPYVLIDCMPSNRLRQTGRDWKPIAGLLLLSLLWSLDSLRADLFPHPASSLAAHPETSLATGAISFFLFAILAALFATLRSAPWPPGNQLWSAAAVGIGLFAVPAVLVSLSSGWIAATTRVAIFSLVPVFAVVLEPYLVAESAPQSRSGLIGALAAVAGTLCIFPLQLPASLAAGSALTALLLAVVSVAAANCRAVHLAHASQAKTIAPIAATAALAAAAALAIASACIERTAWRADALLPQFGQAILALPSLVLLFWLMRRMTAARMTTRFVLAPFMAVLIGMALEQPSVGLRIGIGLLLVASGAAWLLFAPEQDTDNSSLHLTH